MGLSAVRAGVAVVEGGWLIATTYLYGLAVVGLALLAAINLLRTRTPIQGDQQ
jgi:hypothetical protein